MFDFLGQHRHNVDEKGRLFIPSAFREALNEGLVITCGSGPFLALFPLTKWRELSAKLANTPVYTQPKTAALRRKIMANALMTAPDTQGRVRLPEHLRSHASISSSIVLAGVGDHVELWDPDLWEQASAESNAISIEDGQQDLLSI